MASTRQKTKNELRIIEAVSVVEIYNTFVTPLDPKKFVPMSDQRITGLCPFHVDTDPSLRYWKQKNIFHCFGCGFGGDTLRTYMQLRRQHYGDNLDLKTAIRQLAVHFNVEIDEEEGFETLSVFEQARNAILNKETYEIPKSVVTIAQFKKMNAQVTKSKATLNTKMVNFANLDLIATVNIIERK